MWRCTAIQQHCTRAARAAALTIRRAFRVSRRAQRLNLTQREFGQLLAPPGGSAISPSVICQLESALQTVPPPLVSRAVAATSAAQKLGEYFAARDGASASDAASALKVLGPGCIDELHPYLEVCTPLGTSNPGHLQAPPTLATSRHLQPWPPPYF